MNRTNIGWADYVWNPVTGCTKISPGCRNCYAETMALRLQKMGQQKYHRGFEVRMHHDWVNGPSKVKAPQRVFVCSMADLFHEGVTDDFIWAVFQQMVKAEQHTFMVLTKRPERMRRLVGRMFAVGAPPPNIWLGTSIEDQARAGERVPELLATPAALRFVSVEPMLGPVHFVLHSGEVGDYWFRHALQGIARHGWGHEERIESLGWVICGGESGADRRPFDKDWARKIRDDCREADVPFFFKQGSAYKPAQDDILDGEILHDFPSPASAR